MIPPTLLLLVLAVVVGSVSGLIALLATRTLRADLRDLQRYTRSIEARLRLLEFAGMPTDEPVPKPERREAPLREPAPGGSEPEPAAPMLHLELESAEPSLASGPVPSAPSGPADPRAEFAGNDQQWWANFEETVGKRWMTWGGALALFFSVAFFLKHAFENEWLGPTGRVVLGILTGIGLLFAGDYCLRRKLRPLGQGLTGGALAVLYISLFAAFALYRLIPQAPALGAMIVVTAAGMALALLHDAIPLGFLAVLGGLISPLMVSTGQDPRDGLFAYLTVLDFGVLVVAVFRRWRALDVLAFVGTWVLFTGWFMTFYRHSAMAPALIWVAVFSLLFLVVPFLYQLRTGTASPVESFVMAMANAVVTFGFAYLILRDGHQYVLGFVALAMAACYVGLAYLFRRHVPDDAPSLFGFVGLAVVLLTLAVPLHLRLHGITLAWAVEGPVLLYLGYLYRYRPVRIAGFIVLVLAVGRLFLAHWPLHSTLFVPFVNRHFAAAFAVAMAGGVYAVIHARFSYAATQWDRLASYAAAIGSGFIALVLVNAELGEWLVYRTFELKVNRFYLTCSWGAAVWAAGAGSFVMAALHFRSAASFYAGLLALLVATLFAACSYSLGSNHDHLLVLNFRFLAGIAVTLAYVGAALGCYRHKDVISAKDELTRKLLFAGAGVVLLVVLSAELYTYCTDTIVNRITARWAAQMSISVLWALYAVMALGLGFWRRVGSLRIAALALFAVTGLKVVFLDMAQVQQIYRIVSFVVLGVLMISASYLYHRLEARVDGSG